MPLFLLKTVKMWFYLPRFTLWLPLKRDSWWTVLVLIVNPFFQWLRKTPHCRLAWFIQVLYCWQLPGDTDSMRLMLLILDGRACFWEWLPRVEVLLVKGVPVGMLLGVIRLVEEKGYNHSHPRALGKDLISPTLETWDISSRECFY